MRKVEKGLKCIPKSLRVDSKSILSNPARTTYECLLDIISEGKYPKPDISSRYDNRYKMSDVKEQLEVIYYGKCAYCETFVEQAVVEHYRPKRGGYYWLAFSWDNLLLSCPTCNGFKGDCFPVSKARVVYDPERDSVDRIHQLGEQYDKLECPLLVNPEKVQHSEIRSLRFDKDGRIFSKNVRMQRTIEICKLSRKALCERRKKIWDDLRKEIVLAVSLAGDNIEVLSIRLNQTLKSFAQKINDPTVEYIAYRHFVLNKSTWISDCIKELIGE